MEDDKENVDATDPHEPGPEPSAEGPPNPDPVAQAIAAVWRVTYDDIEAMTPEQKDEAIRLHALVTTANAETLAVNLLRHAELTSGEGGFAMRMFAVAITGYLAGRGRH